MNKVVLTPDQVEFIKESTGHLSQGEMCRYLDISPHTLRRLAIEHGIRLKRKPRPNGMRYQKQYGHEKKTVCKCPRCLRLHYQNLFWSGPKPARKFCKSCEKYRVAYRMTTPSVSL